MTDLPAWVTDPQAATPPLDEYLAVEAEEDNLFWWVGCGHHQNLLAEAVAQRDEARAEVERLLQLHLDDCEYCGVTEKKRYKAEALVERLREMVQVNFDLYHEAMENWRAAAAERDELRVRIQLEVDDK